MNIVTLENEVLQAKISLHGAELKSLQKKETGMEYMWNADPAYWGRTSPVLFPFVGSTCGKVYRVDGKEYPMTQHGFARDKDFTVISQGKEEAWFVLEADEETIKIYPFLFRLEIGYRLEGNQLMVFWRVENPNDREMYFSIGAHPAFFCPPGNIGKQTDCFLRLQDKGGMDLQEFTNTILNPQGLVTEEQEVYDLEEGFLPLEEHLFDGDALVVEGHQVQRISLADEHREEYLTVEFDEPVVGIWSPPKKQAPFVCIEPWYGRCDREGFQGELKEREWGNQLKSGEEFQTSYRIIIR